MEEQIVSFEIAKLAKEKKCNITSGWFYDLEDNNKLRYGSTDCYGNQQFSKNLAIHTYKQSLLQRWLREVHNIHINIRHRPHSQSFSFNITGKYQEGNDGELYNAIFNKYETYEQALEAGLQEALKLIK